MAKKLKNDLQEIEEEENNMELDNVIERIESAASKIETAIGKLDGMNAHPKSRDVPPISDANTQAVVVLDEDSVNKIADKCASVTKDEVKTYLENRNAHIEQQEEEVRKYNEEHGIITFDEAYSKLKEKCEKQIDINNTGMKWVGGVDAKLKYLKDRADDLLGRIGIIKPVKPDASAGFLEQQKYYFVSIPYYWLKCFFFDKHTKNYLHIILFCCWLITVGLIIMMSTNETKMEQEVQKYRIIRLWSYTNDSTPVKERCRILDGLFEDEKRNREEIKALVKRIHQKIDNNDSRK